MMFFKCFCEDENVIKVDAYHTITDEVLEDLIHHRLKGGRAVSEAKVHNQWFEKTTVSLKGCFPLVTFFGPHIIITPTYGKF